MHFFIITTQVTTIFCGSASDSTPGNIPSPTTEPLLKPFPIYNLFSEQAVPPSPFTCECP